MNDSHLNTPLSLFSNFLFVFKTKRKSLIALSDSCMLIEEKGNLIDIVIEMHRFIKDYGLNHSSKSSTNNIPNFVTKKKKITNFVDINDLQKITNFPKKKSGSFLFYSFLVRIIRCKVSPLLVDLEADGIAAGGGCGGVVEEEDERFQLKMKAKRGLIMVVVEVMVILNLGKLGV